MFKLILFFYFNFFLFSEYYLVQDVIAFNKFKYGIIDEKGKLILKKEFDGIGSIQNDVLWVRKNFKWGLIHLNGKMLTGFQFVDVREFENGIAVIISECFKWFSGSCEIGKFGLIDSNGKMILEPNFSKFWGKENYKNKTLFNKINGVLVKDENFIMEDGFFRTINENLGIDRNRKIGLVDKLGNEILKPEFINLGNFQNERINFVKSSPKGLYSGFLDKNGNEIQKRNYVEITELTSISNSPVYFVRYREDKKMKQVFLNQNLEEIEIENVRQIYPFTNENKTWFKTNKSKISQINKTGEIDSGIEFDRINFLENQFSVLKKGSQYYLFDRDLKQIFVSEKEIFYGNETILILIEKNKKYKIHRLDETEISSLEFDSVSLEFNHAERKNPSYKLNNKLGSGILSKDGSFFYKEGIDFEYKDDENNYWYKENSMYSFFRDGKNFKIESQEPSEFYFGLAWVSKYGLKKSNSHILYKVLIDENGNEITERKFLYTKNFDGNFAIGQIFGGAWTYINKKGKEVYWSK